MPLAGAVFTMLRKQRGFLTCFVLKPRVIFARRTALCTVASSAMAVAAETLFAEILEESADQVQPLSAAQFEKAGPGRMTGRRNVRRRAKRFSHTGRLEVRAVVLNRRLCHGGRGRPPSRTRN